MHRMQQALVWPSFGRLLPSSQRPVPTLEHEVLVKASNGPELLLDNQRPIGSYRLCRAYAGSASNDDGTTAAKAN